MYRVRRVEGTYRGKPTHHYENERGERIRGVTDILKTLDKPALARWAAKAAAEHAVNEWDALAELPISERLDEIKGAPWQQSKKAMARGTDVHALAEKLVHGEPVDVPAELAPYVEPAARWMDDYDVRPLFVERVVYNNDPEWAGTFDLLARLGDTGPRVLIDYKTGRAIYPEVALQLTMYRWARFIVEPDSDETTMMPACDDTAALLLPGDGTYSFRRVKSSPDLYMTACSLSVVAEWFADKDSSIMGDMPKPELAGQLSIDGEEAQ